VPSPRAPGLPSQPAPDDRGAAPGTTRPGALTAVVVGVGIEVVALVAGAVVLLVELLSGGSQSVGVSLFLVVFAAGVAALLVAAVRGLLQGRRWARSPVATWQILQGVVAVSSLQVGATPWVVVALGLAVAVLVLLMLRPVVEATTRDARPSV
jgi:cytochrome c biogenesis factor